MRLRIGPFRRLAKLYPVDWEIASSPVCRPETAVMPPEVMRLLASDGKGKAGPGCHIWRTCAVGQADHLAATLQRIDLTRLSRIMRRQPAGLTINRQFDAA
jgi:hypothetical protein